MRVHGQHQPLDPRSLERAASGSRASKAGKNARASSASGAAPSRDTEAIKAQAASLAARLIAEAPEERPGAAERAEALLAEPFDPERALKTALRMLQGESRPGDGRPLAT